MIRQIPMYIVIVDNYLPVATCRLYAIDDERVMLGRIVVLPEYRHQGLGTLVVQEAEKWVNELGFTAAGVESRENKTHFYETMGYVADYSQKIVGETFNCYRMEKKFFASILRRFSTLKVGLRPKSWNSSSLN